MSKRFDLTLGDDDFDDLERAMDEVNYWSGPQSSPRTIEPQSRDRWKMLTNPKTRAEVHTDVPLSAYGAG